MTVANWVQVQSIFDDLCKLEPDQRDLQLKNLSNEDPALYEEVSSLLDHHRTGTLFLESNRVDSALTVIKDREITKIPECEGPYEIMELIGVGGMGSVYLAEQTRPVHRTVALKVINAGMNRDEFLARFRYELQALAMLNHPNIAHVLDAGKTLDGRPFFTMEFVPGKSITQFCEEMNLTLYERLKLFVEVVEGVAHAHRRGVIHRDLKPSNILVTKRDQRAIAKIIDFGIAKISDATEGGQQTLNTNILGTPAYMAPESFEKNQIGVGLDIYSLGIVLYQLITGRLPFDEDSMDFESINEMVSSLKTRKAIPIKEAIHQTSHERLPTEPARLKKLIGNGLGAITEKALAPQVEDRYLTSDAFGQDIRDFLEGKPVQAAAGRPFYRLKQIILQNKRKFIQVSMVLLIILVPLINFIKDRQIEFEKARQENLVDLTLDTIYAASAYRWDGTPNPNDVASAIENWSSVLNPYERGRLQAGLAQILVDQQYEAMSLEYLESAVSNFRVSSTDIRNRDYLSARILHAKVLNRANQRNSLEELNEIFDDMNDDWKEFPELEVDARVAKAKILIRQSSDQEAVDLLTPIMERVTDQSIKSWSRALLADTYGFALFRLDRNEEAELFLRRAVEIIELDKGPQNPTTLDLKSTLNSFLSQTGRAEEAYPEAQAIYASALEVLGPDHELSLKLLNRLTIIQTQLGYIKGEDLVSRRRYEYQQRLDSFGAQDKSTLRAMNNLANALLKDGQLDEALRIKKVDQRIRETVFPDNEEFLLVSRITLGEIYAAGDELELAKIHFENIVEGFERLNIRQSYYFYAQAMLGICLEHENGSGKALFQESIDYLKTSDASWRDSLVTKWNDRFPGDKF